MTLQTRKITYEKYLEMPETKDRYEIVDGEMIMAPSPSIAHQRILRELSFLVHQFVTEHGLGEIFFAPSDVVVQKNPLRTRQPDMLFVSTEHSDIVGQVIEGAPDLVVEILSPGNTRSEIDGKMADYARLGVSECWLVAPQGATVEVLNLSDGQWRRLALLGIGDNMRSSVLEGFEIEVSALFTR